MKLRKSLLGLRQAAKQWHIKLKSASESLVFQQGNAEPCVFYSEGSNGERVYVLVYVEDIILAPKLADDCKLFIRKLREKFALSAIGSAHFFLGVQIEHNKKARMM